MSTPVAAESETAAAQNGDNWLVKCAPVTDWHTLSVLASCSSQLLSVFSLTRTAQTYHEKHVPGMSPKRPTHDKPIFCRVLVVGQYLTSIHIIHYDSSSTYTEQGLSPNTRWRKSFLRPQRWHKQPRALAR